MSHKNVTDPLAYVAKKFGEIFNDLINSNVSDERIDQILIEICKEAGTSPEQASACIRGSKESLRVVKNLKLGLGTEDEVNKYISELVEPVVNPYTMPKEALSILVATMERTEIPKKYKTQVEATYLSQFHSRFAFLLISSGIDQMIKTGKTESQIYNCIVTKGINDFLISKDSEIYHQIEKYIETQLQLREDGKIEMEDFYQLSDVIKNERFDALCSAITLTFKEPSNSVKDVLELVNTYSASGMLPENICKIAWDSFKTQGIEVLEDIMKKETSERVCRYITKELAFLKAH